MPGIQINPETLAVSMTSLGPETPISMLNLIRFHEKPKYSSFSGGDIDTGADTSGREAYMTRYLPAWNAIMEKYGGVEVTFLSTSARGIVGVSAPSEWWHAVALIKYKSFDAFRKMTEDADYVQKAEPHRLATIEDWRLIACA